MKYKTIKHNNIMSKSNIGEKSIEIVCRGCTMKERKYKWTGFVSSLRGGEDNSYLIFEEEPNNPYDANAIIIMCRGEFYGTCGYVGKEYTSKIKEILSECELYRIDMVDEQEAGNSEIRLVIHWV